MPSSCIYFWDESRDGLGHLSLGLSDGTYISHWPKETKSKTNAKSTEAKQMRTVEYDCVAEGNRDPDKTIELPDHLISVDKIKEHWKGFTESARYHVITKNCAQVVLQCLETGITSSRSADALEDAQEKFRARFLTALGGTVDADVGIRVADINLTPLDVFELASDWVEFYNSPPSTRPYDCYVV